MTTLEEKFLYEIGEIQVFNEDSMNKGVKTCTSIAKDFAKDFDVWKYDNDYFLQHNHNAVSVYEHIHSDKEYTFDQLVELYEEHLKSKP